MSRPDLDEIEKELELTLDENHFYWHEQIPNLIAYARLLEEQLEDSRTGHNIDKEFLNNRIAELEQELEVVQTGGEYEAGRRHADAYVVQKNERIRQLVDALKPFAQGAALAEDWEKAHAVYYAPK